MKINDFIDWDKLFARFGPDDIEWKPGVKTKDGKKALAMAYVDARAVQRRLDDVIGPEGWQKKLYHTTGGMICSLGIKVDGEWIWKDGAAQETDFESIKGADSGAFKRAASTWGIGRYLYDLGDIWIPVETKGTTIVFKEKPRLPDWAIPEQALENGRRGKGSEGITTGAGDRDGRVGAIIETLITLGYVRPGDRTTEIREIIMSLPDRFFVQAHEVCVKTLDEKRVDMFWKNVIKPKIKKGGPEK